MGESGGVEGCEQTSMLTALYPLPRRIPLCGCREPATHSAHGIIGDEFFCDECSVVKAAESWAAINSAVGSLGYRLARSERGYEVVRDA